MHTLPIASLLIFSSAMTACESPGSSAMQESSTDEPEASENDFARIHDLLRWLPTDTETIWYRRGPFDTFADRPPGIESWDPQLFLLESPLLGVRNGQFELKGLTVERAVQGCKNIRPPTGLGGSVWEGCEIYVFSKNSEMKLADTMRDLIANAESVIELQNVQVAVYKEYFERDEWTFHIAMPSPGVLLCASDREYLNEVLERSAKTSKDHALPLDDRVWDYVDRSSPFAMIRRYRKINIENDQTSPFHENSAWPDPEANALVLASPCDEREQPRLFYLSGNSKRVEIMRHAWTEVHPFEVDAVVKDHDDHAVEITFPNGAGENADDIEWRVMLRFGFWSAV